MYLEKPLQNYLDDLASAQPAPGGGSAVALSGAMAAGLASMVARLTLGNDTTQEIQELLERTETLRVRFQHLMQGDIEAYGRLSTTFKMPRTTSEEKAARTRAIQAQLIEAALVPLEVVESAAELVQYLLRIATLGNVNVLSDVGTATTLASSAGTGASWMVRTNLHAMKNLEKVNEFNNRLNAALDTITVYSQQVINKLGERA